MNQQPGMFDSWLDFGLWVMCWGLCAVIIWELIFILIGFPKVMGFFIKLF